MYNFLVSKNFDNIAFMGMIMTWYMVEFGIEVGDLKKDRMGYIWFYKLESEAKAVYFREKEKEWSKWSI